MNQHQDIKRICSTYRFVVTLYDVLTVPRPKHTAPKSLIYQTIRDLDAHVLRSYFNPKTARANYDVRFKSDKERTEALNKLDEIFHRYRVHEYQPKPRARKKGKLSA